jgi:hypothetical protein
MDTTYPIKKKIKSSWMFIIKTFTSTCVAKILPKLRLQDQRLWEILNSTNVNNLHAHEVARIIWAWTLILSRSSSSSYTWSMKKITHVFSFILKAIMVFIVFKLHKPFWVHVALIMFFSCSERMCVNFSLHLILFPVMFLLLQIWKSFWWSLFTPSFKSLLHSFLAP